MTGEAGVPRIGLWVDRFRRVCLVVLVLSALGCRERDANQERAIQEIGQSHIDANVPTQSNFDRFLRRDLAAYFGATPDKQVDVEYELLRDGPTQSGIAYPKYYVWVRVGKGDDMIEGAVRLAAVEKREFQVTDFISATDLRARPDAVYQVFPEPVCERVIAKLTAVEK